MRNRYWITGLMSLAVAGVFALATWAVAQTPDTTAPAASSQQSPAATPSSPNSPAQGSPATMQQDQGNAPSQNQGQGNTPAQSAPAQSSADNPLGLTEDQKAQLRPIVMQENQQMEAVRNDASLTQEQKIAKANQIRDTASPKIKAILTPEQLQKLAEMQKARQQENQSAPPSDSQKPKQ
jgi:periplasmic protein CpxP/Spy